MRGDSPKTEFIHIKLCIDYYIFWTSATFKVLSIWCKTPIETFFPLLKTVLNLSILMPFSASTIFCFNSSTLAKHLPSRTFSSRITTKKSHSGWDWVNREGSVWASRHFWSKTGNTQYSVGRCARKSPIMIWEIALKASLKQIHRSRMKCLTATPAGTLIQMGF